jgi:hypothetical protein
MRRLLKMLARYSNNLVQEVLCELIDFTSIWEEVLDDLQISEDFESVRITLTKPIKSTFRVQIGYKTIAVQYH